MYSVKRLNLAVWEVKEEGELLAIVSSLAEVLDIIEEREEVNREYTIYGYDWEAGQIDQESGAYAFGVAKEDLDKEVIHLEEQYPDKAFLAIPGDK